MTGAFPSQGSVTGKMFPFDDVTMTRVPFLGGNSKSVRTTGTIDQSHKTNNAPVPYPTIHHSEQKYVHFCSDRCIVGYGTGALWDLLILVYSYKCNFHTPETRSSLRDGIHWFHCSIPGVSSFSKEVNPRLVKRPLKTNGRLANRGLTSLVKDALVFRCIFNSSRPSDAYMRR